MAKIKKIELEVGGKKIILTPKQAKDLKWCLDEMFGKEVIREVYHHDNYRYPWYWEWVPSIPIEPHRITWGSGMGSTTGGTGTVTYSGNTLAIAV